MIKRGWKIVKMAFKSLRENFPQAKSQIEFNKLIDPIMSDVEKNGGSSQIILRIHDGIHLVRACLVPEIDALGKPIKWEVCVINKPISLAEALLIDTEID